MWFGGNDLKKLGNFFWISFNVKMFFLINDPVIWRHRKLMLCCEKSNSWDKLGDNTQNINVQQSLKKLDKWGICLWIQNTKRWVAACGGKRPHHRGGVSSSLLVSGLLGLNLLYALSAIITERKQATGADVTWSAGWRAGELCGTIAGLPWHQTTRRGERRWGGRGRTKGFCKDWGGWVQQFLHRGSRGRVQGVITTRER